MNLGRVFVDTGAWFAIQVTDDAHHNAARRAFPAILEACRSLIQRPIERQAYEILARFSDHPFSFVDATSFALMRENRMRHAFAFDTHFRAAGFLTIPEDVQVLP